MESSDCATEHLKQARYLRATALWAYSADAAATLLRLAAHYEALAFKLGRREAPA